VWFGAPLLKFTGFDGAMVSMFGGSGAGKTLLMRWVQSIYGFHNDLLMLRDDTRNALVSRLGSTATYRSPSTRLRTLTDRNCLTSSTASRRAGTKPV